jgi:type I restriction-modification system DNA methylase subunit
MKVIKRSKESYNYEQKGDYERTTKHNYQQRNSPKIQRILRRKFYKQISIVRETNKKSSGGKRKMRKRTSEFRAYKFILEDLETLGWDTRNPARNVNGQVYTQNECLGDKRILKQLVNLRPENVVKLLENQFYVIEAKPRREEIDIALSEAVDYADKINKSRDIKAIIISGVAGNEIDGYLVKSKFLERSGWKTITVNDRELTSLVSPEIAKLLLNQKRSAIKEIPVDEKIFLAIAERINAILHEGAIEKSNRAKVMSALLLSLIEDTPLNLNESPRILINSINARINAVLQREGKPEFYPFIRIDLPSSSENHNKFKRALVLTVQELLGLNIRSAMNSGTDVLGKFYEVFLKYGNGAKEIGIVLTPRHITKFACEVLDIKLNDIVFDPTCGTGGFLVSAFDYIKRNANSEQIDTFKQNNLFGIENQDHVVALAVVNMIFRGDGKNNLISSDCFKKWLNLKRINNINTAEYLDRDTKNRIPPISKVLMNPPFALKTSDEKEFKFIEQALKQMQDGGLLFSVFPSSNMVKSGQYLNWRRNSLLRDNTLLAVITFPSDLFYPIGVETCGLIIKKGAPNSKNKKVLWIKVRNDGFLKSKGKRLPNERAKNDFEEIVNLVKSFIKNQNTSIQNIKEFQKLCSIDFNDRNLELLPEVYLDEKKPTDNELKGKIEQTLKDSISLMIRFDKIKDFRESVISKQSDFFSKPKRLNRTEWKEVHITDLFETPIKTGYYHVSGILDKGDIPLVSCVSENGGFEGFFKFEDRDTILKNAITIASDGMPLTSFYHYYPFTAKDNVLICKPNRKYKFTTLLFITTQLNSLRWRFSYGRKCYENKAHKIKIFLPFKNNSINEDYIEMLFKTANSWKILGRIAKISV